MRYLLYGLKADADRPLPGLRAGNAPGAPDLRLSIGSHPVDPDSISTPWHVTDRATAAGAPTLAAFRGPDGALRLRYGDGTEFTLAAAAARIGCTWRAPLTLEDAATYLLGPVCGLALRLRGVTCLHASAVALGGRAFLVCGPAGAGKSTTAAAFATRGRAVLADDVAALDAAEGGITVRVAYPQLRLWPDAVRHLYGEHADLPALTPNWEKRYLDLAAARDAFHGAPLPVAAVFLLARRETEDAPRLAALPPSQAVLSLVANTCLGWLPDLAAQARDLALYGRVAASVPVLRAVPHADPARLPALCEAMERALLPEPSRA